MSRIAVNICDLDAMTPRDGGFNPVALLMADFCTVHSPTIVPSKKRLDSNSVILDGPASLDQKRVDALVELLQTVLGPRKLGRRIRCYREGPRGGWPEIRLVPKVVR